ADCRVPREFAALHECCHNDRSHRLRVGAQVPEVIDGDADRTTGFTHSSDTASLESILCDDGCTERRKMMRLPNRFEQGGNVRITSLRGCGGLRGRQENSRYNPADREERTVSHLRDIPHPHTKLQLYVKVSFRSLETLSTIRRIGI